MAHITLRINDRLNALLETHVKRTGDSKSRFIQEAIKSYIGVKRQPVDEVEIIQDLQRRITEIEHRLNTPVLPVAPNATSLRTKRLKDLPNIDPHKEYTTEELCVLGKFSVEHANLEIERHGFVYAGWDGKHNKWKLDPLLLINNQDYSVDVD